ncbi:short-chain dehydrogenase/reductase family 42E member 1 [Vigna unguiculata]|uniref:Sterol-4alpha-carboxylate 3-dehydrogenase n=1 Tax=Vigna unguiculata TaxID=3917 RepID=A0A4D6MBG8_VIGUN|nr:short-chain dehydrogenase/reductase family 42E member 1 [Vigna unguiculata]QCD98772.1 sterol-4alpha-carboxylate 3-dehydrogenase [Vigna unguiculata]
MHLSENEGIEGKAFVVTGGLGFVGSALCLELIRRDAREVRAFDLRSSSPFSPALHDNGVRCIQGDIRRKEDVERALRGADCVFHLAAFGMSGKEMLQFGRVDEVNINGTCHVLDACIDLGITRLVYCSTYNVVFGGQQIINGNETLPYFPIDHHADPYGRSKSIAEQFVLKNNARPLKNQSGNLYTCAIRPAAIYGPAEDRHLPRIVSMAKLGLLLFRIGDQSVKSDWVFVDNLVLALILASMGLLDDNPSQAKRPVAAGQAYFISDGSPVNSFEFLQPLLRSLDYELPKTTLPVDRALVLGRICSAVYTILYPWLNRWWLPQPFILPSEVHKVGVTHYFSYLKARQEIGYVPMVTSREGMALTISYWQQRKRATLDGPTIYAWLFGVIGMVALFCGAFLPDIGIVFFLRATCLFVFRSMWVTRLVFLLATIAHIAEAIYAWHLAQRVDPSNARGWFWQTFALGMFSLRFLLKRART